MYGTRAVDDDVAREGWLPLSIQRELQKGSTALYDTDSFPT
jgi:hypothetical protein